MDHKIVVKKQHHLCVELLHNNIDGFDQPHMYEGLRYRSISLLCLSFDGDRLLMLQRYSLSCFST